MKDRGPFRRCPFLIAAFGTNKTAGPRGEGGEGDPIFLVCLLHAGGLEVLQDHLLETLPFALASFQRVDQLVVLVHAQHAVRRQALDSKRPGHATFFLSS